MDTKGNSQRKDIRDRVKKYSQKASAVYWSAILNLVSFFIVCFNHNRTYSIGYTCNVLLHELFLNLDLNIGVKLTLSGICALIISLIFFALGIFIKKGKLKPLIAAFLIYSVDTLLLFFTPYSFYVKEGGDGYSMIMAYGVHIVMFIYYIYLLVTYNKIVKDSLFTKRKNQEEKVKKE